VSGSSGTFFNKTDGSGFRVPSAHAHGRRSYSSADKTASAAMLVHQAKPPEASSPFFYYKLSISSPQACIL